MMRLRASIKGEAGQVPGVATMLWEFLFGKAAAQAIKVNNYLMATRPYNKKGNKKYKGGQVIECFG